MRDTGRKVVVAGQKTLLVSLAAFGGGALGVVLVSPMVALGLLLRSGSMVAMGIEVPLRLAVWAGSSAYVYDQKLFDACDILHACTGTLRSKCMHAISYMHAQVRLRSKVACMRYLTCMHRYVTIKSCMHAISYMHAQVRYDQKLHACDILHACTGTLRSKSCMHAISYMHAQVRWSSRQACSIGDMDMLWTGRIFCATVQTVHKGSRNGHLSQ